MKLFATSGIHTLLENNKAKEIGFTCDGKRYTDGGGCIIPLKVCLHYGTDKTDTFYFENNTLVYDDVYINRPLYIDEIYSTSARKNDITPEQFIERVKEVFTMTELGLLNNKSGAQNPLKKNEA